MISDEEVVRQFADSLSVPDMVSGMLKLQGRPPAGFRIDSKVSLQVYRGEPMSEWGCAQPAVCTRHTAVFNTFGVIPRYCFDCFKIQILPGNVLDLFKVLILYDRLQLPRDMTRKCMVETRNYSTGAYKGYVYCRGYEEANAVLGIVRKAIAEEISPAVTVAMRRCNTEYALLYPEFAETHPDRQMKYRPEWQVYEDFVDENFVFDALETPDSRGQAKISSREVFAMQFWLRYAATIGDSSYLALTGGNVLESLPGQGVPG